MTTLYLPASETLLENFKEIQDFLKTHNIQLSRWNAAISLKDTDSQETILKAYEHEVLPFMKSSGFTSADVINVHPKMENLEALREKFLSEHIHSEDEVRFFVDGSGKFWFNFEDEIGEKTIACITCRQGDFLSVPAGQKHWFDLAPEYFVKAIRIFTNKEGWVANYTGSGIDKKYNH